MLVKRSLHFSEGAAHIIETLRWKMSVTVFNRNTPCNHGDWPMTNVNVQFGNYSASLYLSLGKENTKIYNWHNQCKDAFTPRPFCNNALLLSGPNGTRHRCLTLVALWIAVHCHDNDSNNNMSRRSSETSKKVKCLVSIWPEGDFFPDVGHGAREALWLSSLTKHLLPGRIYSVSLWQLAVLTTFF